MTQETERITALEVKYGAVATDLKDIKKDVKSLADTLNDFITTVKSEYLTEEEAEKKYAGKIIQSIMYWIAAALGSGFIALLGMAFMYFLKNGLGPT